MFQARLDSCAPTADSGVSLYYSNREITSAFLGLIVIPLSVPSRAAAAAVMMVAGADVGGGERRCVV